MRILKTEIPSNHNRPDPPKLLRDAIKGTALDADNWQQIGAVADRVLAGINGKTIQGEAA